MPIFISRLWWTYFPRIVAKIRRELKLINVDFVLGGQTNQKYSSDFREVQISFSVSFVP